jgi:hypothetical protein
MIEQQGLPSNSKHDFELDEKLFEDLKEENNEKYDIATEIFSFMIEPTNFGFYAKETLNGLYDRINRFCPKKDQISIEKDGDNYKLKYKKYTREKYFKLIKKDTGTGFIMTETLPYLYDRINEFCSKDKQISVDFVNNDTYRLIYKID